jgi:GNAT superfamily N-acetyltransferase
MSFEVQKILSKNDLKEAINFIHSNNFSLKTSEKKISFNFDGRILGLLIKDNDKIVGNIFYYYQPDFNYNNHTYKVVNFATIFVLESYRGKGISKLMIKKTLEFFKDYIITDYTPVGSIMHVLKKFDFGFMKNNRNLIFPIPTIKFNFFKFFFGKLVKIDDREIIQETLKNLENYRHYEIDLWNYTIGKENIMIGAIERLHNKKIGFFKIKLNSKRILWTNNEELLLKYANNIAFNFSLLNKTQFITVDAATDQKPFFSIKLENQFMIYPKFNTKISTYGSEFFANNL